MDGLCLRLRVILNRYGCRNTHTHRVRERHTQNGGALSEAESHLEQTRSKRLSATQRETHTNQEKKKETMVNTSCSKGSKFQRYAIFVPCFIERDVGLVGNQVRQQRMIHLQREIEKRETERERK